MRLFFIIHFSLVLILHRSHQFASGIQCVNAWNGSVQCVCRTGETATKKSNKISSILGHPPITHFPTKKISGIKHLRKTPENTPHITPETPQKNLTGHEGCLWGVHLDLKGVMRENTPQFVGCSWMPEGCFLTKTSEHPSGAPQKHPSWKVFWGAHEGWPWGDLQGVLRWPVGCHCRDPNQPPQTGVEIIF